MLPWMNLSCLMFFNCGISLQFFFTSNSLRLEFFRKCMILRLTYCLPSPKTFFSLSTASHSQLPLTIQDQKTALCLTQANTVCFHILSSMFQNCFGDPYMRTSRWLKTQIKEAQQYIWISAFASLSKHFPHHQRIPITLAFLVTKKKNSQNNC